MALYDLGGGGGGGGWTDPGVIDWSKLPGGQNPFDPANPTTPNPTTPANPFAPTEKPVATAPGAPGSTLPNGMHDPSVPQPRFAPELTNADLEKVAGGKQSNTPGVTPQSPTMPAYVNANDPTQAAVYAAFQQKGITPRDQQDFQYWVDKINQTGGFGDAGNKAYWLQRMAQSQGGVGDYLQRPEAGSAPSSAPNSAQGAPPPANGSGTVFSDPATAAWEKALNALVTKLQGPAYTPEQQALIHTSVTEPITQAQDAAHQALIRNLAGRNITPTSGIAQDQGAQLDRYFQQQRDLADRGFATNAIGVQNQNQLSALDLLKQVPQYADSRLSLALATMAPQSVNPLNAMNTYLNQNNLSDQQTQQYWLALGQALATLFGGK